MTQIDGKTVFDGMAQLYDEARPSYPEQLVADVIGYADLPEDGRVMEIGCGPGKATIQFATYGHPMLCVEPGPNLVAVAREKCKDYPVEFQVCSFEDCTLADEEFGLVYAASAFHWLNREIALPKIANALKACGALAIIRNRQAGLDSGISEEINELAYKVHAPELVRTSNESKHVSKDQLEESGLFEDVTVKTYPWSRVLTTNDYLKLLETHSGHRVFPQERKRPLYQAIGEIIDRHGGSVTKPYVATVLLARRKP